ncbi:MAG: zinc finger domain-containing protein [archaeon]
MKHCISCKDEVTNDSGAAIFICPQCGTQVIRCSHCRKTAVNYKCKCGFEGP